MPDARQPIPISLTKPHRVLGVAAVLVLILVTALFAYRASEKQGFNQMRDEASHQLDILAAAIDSEVTRHASIPSAVELNPDVLALLRAPAERRDALQATANRFLQKLNDHLGGPAIFVLDTSGRVVASSDWIFSDNLLGADLSNIPLFRDAVAGTPGRHYAVDNVRQEPGYFFALPIRDEQQDWKVIGVAVVKSSLHELERRWLGQEAPALIVDANGIVLLASPPEWRYATLQPQNPAVLARISQEQFAGQPLGVTSLDIAIDAAQEGTVVRLSRQLKPDPGPLQGAKSYLALSRHLPGTAWRIVVFSDLRPVFVQASTHAALAAAAIGCFLLWLAFLSQRRRLARGREEARAMLEQANQELERNVAARTADLSEAVTGLQREVAERQRAEQTLRAAQDELVQAAKLAVLGQMATGITHELSQPLGAIRTLSANAVEFMHRGDLATAEKNLGIVGQLAEQAGGIITPLKTFARKSPAVSVAVDVAQAVDAALFLFDARLKKMNVTVNRNFGPKSEIAWCDQNRLQQVLVNLIGNAIDAMADEPERRLTFSADRASSGQLALAVSDSGFGFTEKALEHLFEPFFTTKQPGEGLGLGLTISRDILRDFGGDLLAGPAPGGGARFVILLPAVPPATTSPEKGLS
ncbi:sensor histidine kinase [Ferribacterium limneticum]|uniref:sensor histidine kinase n=1 Tax=Ferribacterium limneticum TaxID=76259 RepID=UPI001CFA4A2F|nr:ATP-binding protein [Ferribacterium limneticum]UCV19586.1 sensor histidine kinase [Ferribacterium limneticum]